MTEAVARPFATAAEVLAIRNGFFRIRGGARRPNLGVAEWLVCASFEGLLFT
jgi:hypothetical protein